MALNHGMQWKTDMETRRKYLQDVTTGKVKEGPDCIDGDKQIEKLFKGVFPDVSIRTCKEADETIKKKHNGASICQGYKPIGLESRHATAMCPVTCGLCAPPTPASDVIKTDIEYSDAKTAVPVIASLAIEDLQSVTNQSGLLSETQRRLIERVEPGKRASALAQINEGIQSHIKELAGKCFTPCGTLSGPSRWCYLSPMDAEHLKTMVPESTLDADTGLGTRPCAAHEAGEAHLLLLARRARDAVNNWSDESDPNMSLPGLLTMEFGLNMHSSFALCKCDLLDTEEKIMTAALFDQLSNMCASYKMALGDALVNLEFIKRWKAVLQRFRVAVAPPPPAPKPPPPKLTLEEKLRMRMMPEVLPGAQVTPLDQYLKQLNK